MVRRNIAIGALTLAAVEFLCAASLQAVPIPGSSAVVDPFNFDFTGAGSGSYQITAYGVPVPNLTGDSAGFSSGVGETTFRLPDVTESGDVAVIDPRINLNSLLLSSGGIKYNGVYLIPVAWADSHLGDFLAAMQFTPAGQGNSYLQFYFDQNGVSGIPSSFAQPVLFSSQEYLLAIPGTEGANGSLSFSFQTGVLAGNPYDNKFSGSAQCVLSDGEPITTAPEPSSRVVFFGLFGMAMVAMAFGGWRKGFGFRLAA